jgi:hypothetical protein
MMPRNGEGPDAPGTGGPGGYPAHAAQGRDVDFSALRAALLSDALAPLFWPAQRQESPAVAWNGHIPFAHWLVHATRPGTIVELGTHAGVSYSAFCEAVIRAKTKTRCFAVDTWKGDEQAGFYDESIYADFKQFHDIHYARFSKLMRMTFDEAVSSFPDGSIDLLHIDGLHSYEAVSRDFTTWLPKLSAEGIILFHDTNEYQKDFAVWRLWSDLEAQYPSFEFLHSHGLGVLCVGDSPPAPVLALCQSLDVADIAAVRTRFQFLGERWMADGRARADRERRQILAERDQLSVEIAAATEELRRLRAAKTAIVKSVSWRIAAPIRAIEAILLNLQGPRDYRALKKSGLLDQEWYLMTYPDVAEAGADPVIHYLRHGAFEGRNPSRDFDTNWYLSEYPDIAAEGVNPLVHYLKWGATEGRKPKPLFD